MEQDAISRRVDLQIARIELEALAKSYGLTNATRFVNLLQPGIYKDTRESCGTENVQFRDFGPGATVEIPIFDLGEVRVRQAEQSYMLALNRLIDVFTLLAEARQRILSTIKAIEAKRDFWIAKTDLQVAIVGGWARSMDEGFKAKAIANTGVDRQTTNSTGDRP